MRNTKLLGTLLAAAILATGLSGPAWGQAYGSGGDDPLVFLPQMFMIIDSSGSMASNMLGEICVSHQCKRQCVNNHDCMPNTCSGGYCNDGVYPACNPAACPNPPRVKIDGVRYVLTGMYHCTQNTPIAPGILNLYQGLINFGYTTYDDDWSQNLNYPNPPTTDGIGNIGMQGRGYGAGSLIDVIDKAHPNNFAQHASDITVGACNATALTNTPLGASIHDALLYFQNWRTEINFQDSLDKCYPKFLVVLTDGQGNDGEPAPYGGGAANTLALWNSNVPNPAIPRVFAPFYPAKVTGVPTFIIALGMWYDDAHAWCDPIAAAGSGGLLPSFYAADMVSLQAQFTAILNLILTGTASRTNPVSAPSLTSSSNAFMYAAYFQVTPNAGVGWSGHLTRIPMYDNNADGQAEISNNPAEYLHLDDAAHFGAQDPTQMAFPAGRVVLTVVNDPRSQTPAHQAAMPRVRDDANSDTGLYPFMMGYHGNANALDNALCDAANENVIKKFIRGVPGTPAAGGSWVTPNPPQLGDFFHSQPVVVPPPSSLAPDWKYEYYFGENAWRDTMVYIGGNDGMLHAFVGEHKGQGGFTPGLPTGGEKWAFIPTNILPKLEMAMTAHTPLVDGSPVVRDAFLNNFPLKDAGGVPVVVGGCAVKGAYRTILISGERAGGSAYFALDVTDPDKPLYLWEYRTDVPPTVDYSTVQCQKSQMETWAQPIIGQVWLKNAQAGGAGCTFQPDYLTKTVVLFPGGYISPETLTASTRCVDFAQAMMGSSSLYAVDLESGKLLKKFLFTKSVDANVQSLIDLWWTDWATNEHQGWHHWGGGNDFTAPGWECQENLGAMDLPLIFPVGLTDPGNCTITDNATDYIKDCALHGCKYYYHKPKNQIGGLEIFVDFEGDPSCNAVNKGKFRLDLDNAFFPESVAATPAAYSTALGEYITTVFVPTTGGRVYRIDLERGLYDSTRAEGDQVIPYTAGGVTYKWDVGRDIHGDPDPWFDTGTNDFIMVTPTLALSYGTAVHPRDLVLYFGTGRIDNLQPDVKQYEVFAVEETKHIDIPTGRYIADAHGSLFGAHNPLILPGAGERLFGPPLVVGGKVVFSTFVPATSDCTGGSGNLYLLRFDDFDPSGCTAADSCVFAQPSSAWGLTGPVQAPVLIQSSTGIQAVIQSGTTLVKLPAFQGLDVSAKILHWASVL